MIFRFAFTKKLLCSACNCKRTRKKCQKANYENVLNDQKYHKILQNSNISHTQSKLQGEIFATKGSSESPHNKDDFFYPKWEAPKPIKNTPNF